MILRQRVDFMVRTESTARKLPAGRPAVFWHGSGKWRGTGSALRAPRCRTVRKTCTGNSAQSLLRIFGWSNAAFRQRYMVMGGFQNHQIVDYRNLDELNRKFYSVAFPVTKDVLDLPPEMHVTYTCELGPEAGARIDHSNATCRAR